MTLREGDALTMPDRIDDTCERYAGIRGEKLYSLGEGDLPGGEREYSSSCSA